MNTNIRKSKVALVVDDELVVCQSLQRLLKDTFDEVITTTNPKEADTILSGGSITHLICDCSLGEGLPLGIYMIPGWRKLCPSIERAVVFTGTDLSRNYIPAEVDVILDKSAHPGELVRALIPVKG